MIANILFEANVGWWQTWTFSGDFENPDVFYPILLMALRAISWMDVAFSILFLFACAQALCGLLKVRKALSFRTYQLIKQQTIVRFRTIKSY